MVINLTIPLYQFPRVDPDGDAPCTHLKNPPPRLRARAEAVVADRGGQAGAALPRGGHPARPPPALPQLPESSSEPKSGGRKPKLPDHTSGGHSHLSGWVLVIYTVKMGANHNNTN